MSKKENLRLTPAEKKKLQQERANLKILEETFAKIDVILKEEKLELFVDPTSMIANPIIALRFSNK